MRVWIKFSPTTLPLQWPCCPPWHSDVSPSCLRPELRLSFSFCLTDKETVSKWFAVLMERQLPRQQRNAYLAYLNFQMQNMKISDPFDKDPPTSLTEANQLLKVKFPTRICWIHLNFKLFPSQQAKMSSMMAEMESKNVREIMLEGLTPSGMAGFRSAYKPPAEFLADHCTPTNGLVAYGGCFSNHFQWICKDFNGLSRQTSSIRLDNKTSRQGWAFINFYLFFEIKKGDKSAV